MESVFERPSIPLLAEERASAQQTFYVIVDHFAALEQNAGLRPGNDHYSQAGLIRYTYEFALSRLSKDIFLRALFQALALNLHPAPDAGSLHFDELAPLFAGFAEYLMDSFFLPLKASAGQTPQPSPVPHSAVLRAQGGSVAADLGSIGTTDRLATLRGTCLVRDRHRCVISRKFSYAEFRNRLLKFGADARDDDGVSFPQSPNLLSIDNVEVAHVLPHSLMKANSDMEMDKSRQAALAILNMFDYGVAHIIDGVDIDRPTNALTLTHTLHLQFGAFKVFFEAEPNTPNTYNIRSFLPAPLNTLLGLPVRRTLFVTDTHTIDPPSPRLLAVHRAIAHILHLSAAGDYIDRVLRDMETNLVRADGSSELGRLVGLRLGGWVDGRVY